MNCDKIKIFAVVAVVLMTAVCFVPMDSDVVDADSSEYYTVTVNFTGQTINSVTIDGVAATAATISSDGSWGFDANGFGPFKSFYAAVSTFDETVIAPLNPDDLSETISGDSVDISSGAYNVFWVLPTVYWSTTSSSYTLTNNPNAGGTAYAHTIDGQVAPYVGYAVYEGKVQNNKLLSVSGSSPSASLTRAVFRTDALNNETNNDDGQFMIWNYFQWTLYKMCSYAVMGSKDSDTFSRGNVDGSWGDGVTANHASTSGLGDSSGPFAASQTTNDVNSYEKLFIENAWGSVWDFVDDVSFHDRKIYAGQNSDASWCDAAYSNTWDSNCLVRGTYTLPSSNNYIQSTQTDAVVYDLPSTVDSTGYDYMWQNSGDRCVLAGGSWSDASKAGVSSFNANVTLSRSYAFIGARLAYVFSDAGAASENPLTWDSEIPSGNYLVGSAIDWLVSLSVPGCTILLDDAPNWLAYQNGHILGSVANSYSAVSPVSFNVIATSPGGQTLTQAISISVEPVIKFTSKPTASCIVIPIVSYHADGSLDAAVIDDIREGMISERTGNSFRFVFIGSYAENVRWDFGDGTVAEGNSVIHEYSSAGTYTVVCEAVNSEGTDSCSVEVVVEPDYSDYVMFGIFALLIIAALILIFKCRKMSNCRRR